jgi:hypothetical protein
MIASGTSRTMIRRGARLALLPAAALLVHQLRYTLAFGGHAGIQLERQGHAYLHSLVPWIVALLAVAVGAFLWALGRALSGQRTLSRYTLSLTGLWLTCAGALVAIYVTQELLEGLLATGHPIGLAGVFGYGGWWSIPAALCVGLVLATILHGARWVLDEVAERRGRQVVRRVRSAATHLRWIDAPLPQLSPLADGWSGRGPPR